MSIRQPDSVMTATKSRGVPKAEPPQPRRSRFTTSERRARGKAARSEVPRSAHGAWEPASIRRDPVELLEEQARTRLPELVPIRYGRMLVSPFTFFRGAAYIMAADLADGARTGLAHAALRRRAPLQFRVLRRSGSSAGVQHQRFRRDVAGAVRMGCETAGGELRRRRSGSRVRRGDAPLDRPGDRARLPRGDGALRGDAEHRRLVHAPGRRRDRSAVLGQDDCQGQEADGGRPGQGADEGQRPGARQALSRSRRRAADRRQPTADHADRGRLAGGRASAPRRGHPPHDRHLRGVPATRSAGAPRALSLRSRCA